MIATFEKSLAKAEASRTHHQESLVARTASLEKLTAQMADLQLATALIQEVAKETQDQFKIHVQDLVQSAINAVFPGTYNFKLEFVPKRNRTEVEIYLLKDGTRVNPMDSSGGGVVDVVSFALRVVSWSISGTSNTLILDEPFKWVSVNLRPRCAELLRTLSDRLKLQIIMVTHDAELVQEADRIFTVDQKRRKSFIVMHEGTKQ